MGENVHEYESLCDSDEDDDELEINEMAAESLKGRKSAKKKIETNLSDDDF